VKRCCAGDEGLSALRSRPAGGGFKPPHAAGTVTWPWWAMWKRRARRVRWGSGRRAQAIRCWRVEKETGDIETGVSYGSRDEPGGCPLTGQVVSGMEATRARSAASAWNGRRPDATLPVRVCERARGRSPCAAWVWVPLRVRLADRLVVVGKLL